MITVVIIEDEAPARRKLRRFLADLDEPVTVVAELTTVAEAILFLQTGNAIDLILSDIALQDGDAFAIYNAVPLSCPIIFTTAYDQFLMDAFETNGIEYLLKPFSFERFKKAWDKFLLLKHQGGKDRQILEQINHFMEHQGANKSFKQRFSIPSKRGTYFLDTIGILFFVAEDGMIAAVDVQGKRHMLSQPTLKEIESVLDPSQFFRINRSELVNKQHIERIERYAKNTIAITLADYTKHLVTSQSATALFREWLEA